ncbi:general secretion pathway protein GspB [Vibrio aestuarianus]|uniref:General secretion pathway protein GspB n=1 Tax=Vibrio aestuarianus TaxID=28171 RepID=A0A9X4IRZ9_9VIBR|nr:general secretion pathway protein GspB [Vibrio aestuarianus]MDE1240794.1 general secretion pathway protein GspB [Vibrio aestuarianus]
MSQVLKALEQSEISHQQNAPVAFNLTSPKMVIRAHKLVSLKNSLLLCMPTLACLGYLSYQSYQARLHEVDQIVQNGPRVVTESAPYQLLDYPDFADLKAIPRLTSQPSDSVMLSSQSEHKAVDLTMVSQNGSTVVSSSEKSEFGLGDVDLSQLSPLLVQRVELALQDNGQQTASASSAENVLLTEHADEFAGRLPALNFQTHVYSSRADKRWVKINGVERVEGDVVTSDVNLLAIEPQSTVILFNNQRIEIPALYDWQG